MDYGLLAFSVLMAFPTYYCVKMRLIGGSLFFGTLVFFSLMLYAATVPMVK